MRGGFAPAWSNVPLLLFIKNTENQYAAAGKITAQVKARGQIIAVMDDAAWSRSNGVRYAHRAAIEKLRKDAGDDESDEDEDENEDDEESENEDGEDGESSNDDADFNAKHPRWPAGSPDGTGGEFAPKDGGDTAGAAATTTDTGSITTDQVKTPVTTPADKPATSNNNSTTPSTTSAIPSTSASQPTVLQVTGDNIPMSSVTLIPISNNSQATGTQVAADLPTTILNILNGSTPDPEKPILNEAVPQINRVGDWGTANNDFDSLHFISVQNKGDGVRVGTMTDGYIAVVRPLSVPTIDIRDPNGTLLYKIRYKQ